MLSFKSIKNIILVTVIALLGFITPLTAQPVANASHFRALNIYARHMHRHHHHFVNLIHRHRHHYHRHHHHAFGNPQGGDNPIGTDDDNSNQSQANESDQNQSNEQSSNSNPVPQHFHRHHHQSSQSGIRKHHIISTAKSKLGDHYSYGATGPDRFDCSGFTQYAYRHGSNISLPRTAQAQYNDFHHARHARRAELVFFGKAKNNITHVGICLNRTQMIDAQNRGVVIENIHAPWWNLQGFARV